MDDLADVVGSAIAPPAASAPQGAAGRFGTPANILDNLRQVESSGNAYAINKDTKAMGQYQFTPETVATLHQRGIQFDPFNPQQARDAADFYLSDLAKKNGGDYSKALAQYGGFKTKSPDAYVGKVMGTQTPFGDLADTLGGIKAEAPAPTASAAPSQAAAAPAEQPGALASLGAGAGKAFGSSMLALQQWLGKGISAVGSIGQEQGLSDLVAPHKNAMQAVGDWLSSDAAAGARKLEAENAPYEAAHPIANVGGQVGSMVVNPINKVIPGGPAETLIGSAVKGGLQGAALNAATSPVTNEQQPFLLEKAKQAGLGLVGGVVGGTLGHGLSVGINKGIDALKSGVSRVFSGDSSAAADAVVKKTLSDVGADVSSVPPDLYAGLKTQVQDALASGGKVDPQALTRLTQAQTLPVPVPMLKGQITRDPMQFAKEQNLRGIQGVGEPLTQTLQAQNKALIQNLDAMGASGAPDIISASRAGMDALTSANAKAQQEVRNSYTTFRNATGKDLDVPLQGVAQDYADTLKTFGSQIPGAIRKQFEDLGLMNGTARKTFGIDDAESLIKDINANYDPMNRPASAALDRLRGSVQRAITEGAGADAQGANAASLAQAARQTAAKNFALIDSTPALRDTIRGIEPDKFLQKYVLQGNVGEIRNMMGVISRENPEAAAGLQNSLMGFIKNRVLNGVSSENGVFSQAQLKQFTNDPNMSARLTEVLGPQRMAQIQQLNQVAENALYRPATSAVNTSNTAQAAANLIKGTVQGGGVNRLLDIARGVPGLSTAAEYLQGAHQTGKASDLINEALTPSVSAQGTGTALRALPGIGARAGAAYLGSQRKGQ